MKHIYGLVVLLLSNILTSLLMFQFYINEEPSTIKLLILLISFLLLLIIDFKSLLVMTKKIKKGLEGPRREKALKKVVKQKYRTNILLSVFALLVGATNYIYFVANKTINTITLSLEPSEFESYLIVPKDSDIESATDEALIYIGFDQAYEHYQSLMEDVLIENYDKYAYVHYQPYFYNYQELKNELFNEEVHAMFISQSTLDLYRKIDLDFDNSIRILETYTVKTSIAPKEVNVSKEPFNVLILGVDIRESEGDIHSNTRSDTIMIASFNPNTMQASLISIPRDTYTPLSYNGQYDKLTHASSYGTGCIIETVEDLLSIDINYYAKFNFKALVGLVDALGGIEVDVKFSFTESNSDDVAYSISVEKGLQTLNGEEALAYARHRETQNDHVRNNSQQEVLTAILKKLVSFDSITKVNDLLNVLNKNMTTNIQRNEILDLITIAPSLGQLQITTKVIDGEDSLLYVPKYDEDLWVTELSEDSLKESQDIIETIFKGTTDHDID